MRCFSGLILPGPLRTGRKVGVCQTDSSYSHKTEGNNMRIAGFDLVFGVIFDFWVFNSYE
jgi:hypothetical protein